MSMSIIYVYGPNGYALPDDGWLAVRLSTAAPVTAWCQLRVFVTTQTHAASGST